MCSNASSKQEAEDTLKQLNLFHSDSFISAFTTQLIALENV